MRYRPEHKVETHRRIVETASKEFRTHGFEAVGIANLMGVLNLTHGGFYAHFAGKEELVTESLVAALNQNLGAMLAALETGGFPALIDYYLSDGHRDHPGLGCPLPALAPEVARRSPVSREAFTEKLSEVYRVIAGYMPGQTQVRKLEKVNVLFASLVGAVVLARAVSDPALSESMLRSTRDHLLRFLAETED